MSIGYKKDHRVSLLANTPSCQARIIEPVRVRLIRKLLEIFPDADRDADGGYVFELHQPTVAKAIQTTRESVARLFSVMRKDGLVTIEKKGHKNLVSVKNRSVLIMELAKLTTGKSLHDKA